MTAFHRIACFALVATLAPALHAKPHCPGSVTSLHFRPGHGSQIIAPVMINHTGPYYFLIDTGTEVTILDSGVAVSLQLNSDGAAQLVGIGFHEQAGFARTASLELGAEEVTGLRIVVQSFQSRLADLRIRGILGGDFLSHFDLLIDNAHQVLCLDQGDALRAEFRSNHVDLEKLPGQSDDAAISRSPVITANLSGLSATQHLLLDSGATVPLLYGGGTQLAAGPAASWALRGTGAGGVIRNFTALPAQDMRIGSVNFARIIFVALREGRSDIRPIAADGVLSTGIFRRIFISYSAHFAVVEPW
ncbi:MAG: aspartyl protease family protein [Silvibacterium sp.]|nr:aspartyl protease family protein [Silvibacterium sp.]